MNGFRAAGQLDGLRVEALAVNIDLLANRAFTDLPRKVQRLEGRQCAGDHLVAILEGHLTRRYLAQLIRRCIDPVAHDYRSHQVALVFRAIIEWLQNHLVKTTAAVPPTSAFAALEG